MRDANPDRDGLNEFVSEISKAVVQMDFPLIQMKIQEFSLDDIYMKYFKEN